jgi:hypothetical protein
MDTKTLTLQKIAASIYPPFAFTEQGVAMLSSVLEHTVKKHGDRIQSILEFLDRMLAVEKNREDRSDFMHNSGSK